MVYPSKLNLQSCLDRVVVQLNSTSAIGKNRLLEVVLKQELTLINKKVTTSSHYSHCVVILLS